MTDVVLRDLSASELSGPEVRELLRLATEFDDAGLDRVVSDVLPRLTVLAAIDDGVPVALAAYAPSAPAPGPARPAGPEPDLQPEPATIEYLATAGARRRTGLAGALIAEIRRRHPRAAVRASTTTTRSASTAPRASSTAPPRRTRAGRGSDAMTASSALDRPISTQR